MVKKEKVLELMFSELNTLQTTVLMPCIIESTKINACLSIDFEVVSR